MTLILLSQIPYASQGSLEELEKTILKIESESEYLEIDLEIWLGHLYHHVNTAWNGRHQSDNQHKLSDQADFNRFRRFPSEEEFHILTPLQKITALRPPCSLRLNPTFPLAMSTVIKDLLYPTHPSLKNL